MEAIKCPNCGSEKVRKITEEKYECLACDNLFLVHNLSKEFRQTDEHIENVHQDLKKTIEHMNFAASGGSGKDGLDNRYKNAMTLLKQGNISAAQQAFNKIKNDFIWSYKGYYGLVLCEIQKDRPEWNAVGEYIRKINLCEDITPDIKAEMEKVLSDGKQSALGQLGNALNAENAKQAELSNNIKQLDEMTKIQENSLSEKKEEFSARWEHNSATGKAVSIIVAVVCAIIGIVSVIFLFRWIADVRYLFSNAMSYGFFAGIGRILLGCVRTILRVAISVGVVFLIIMFYFLVFGIITANPQKDSAQQNIDKINGQMQVMLERRNNLQAELNVCQNNIQNINRIGSNLEQLQKINVEEIIPLLIAAGQYY